MLPRFDRRTTFRLLSLLLLFLVCEGIAVAVFAWRPRSIAMRAYFAASVPESHITSYLADRDERLGWPSKRWLQDNAEPDGSRPSPAARSLQGTPSCASVYGDSFAYAAEVDHRDAWPNRVAERLKCPVKNFGMSGYGVDQAVLRAIDNPADDAAVTILAIFPDDIQRNRNQWRHLVCPGCDHHELGLKPRFVVAPDGSVSVRPLVAGSAGEIPRLFDEPAAVLDAEDLLPDAPARQATRRVGFPYSLSLVRVLADIVGALDPQRISRARPKQAWSLPYWFDGADGPSAATLALNTAVIRHFAESPTCRARKCVVLMLPDVDALFSWRDHGRDTMDLIAAPLRPFVTVWNPTEYMVRAMSDRSICFHVGRRRDCRGHYNVDGYALLARYVTERLRAEGTPPRG